MRKFRPRKPSAALLISVVALLAALGGTSYAAFSLPKNSVGTKQLKKNAVTTNKISNGAVTANKINSAGLTVPNADHANSANTAASATNAINATNATSAQPVAFAHVNDAGNLDASRSKNIGTSTRIGSALYCLADIPFTVRGGQATVDEQDSGFESAQLGIGSPSGCPSGTQAFVLTVQGTTSTPAGFYVHLYG